jgi:deoxyribonuclease IV
MLFGAHVSIAGGIQNAPQNAKKIGCEVFQMFSRSPRGGKPIYTENNIKEFLLNCEKNNYTKYYIHAPYYINFASANNKIRHGSINALREELEIGSKIKASAVMAHMGSAKDFTEKEALDMVVSAIDKILDGYNGTTRFLIEISAGSGQIIGDTFEEIGYILKKTKSKEVGVCFDTCHAFASGYDMRTKAALDKTLQEFDDHIGLEKLVVLHLNDSMTELGSRIDRHADIGEGKIGELAFKTLINHPLLKNINGIIETPSLKKSDDMSLKLLKSLRK